MLFQCCLSFALGPSLGQVILGTVNDFERTQHSPSVAEINSSDEGNGLIDDNNLLVMGPKEVVDVGSDAIWVTKNLEEKGSQL